MNGRWVGCAVVVMLLATPTIQPAVGGAVGALSGGQMGESAKSPIEVSRCRTIDEPGHYVLTADIENSSESACITIVASDVVFDGQGHVLDAREVDYPTEAVAAGYTDPQIENVTIRDLVVTDWTQGVGCRSVAADVTIANVTARRNGLNTTGGGYGAESEGYGIYVGDLTHNVTVRASVAIANAQGIYIANTSHNVIRDNFVARNHDSGIVLGPKTWDNRIVGNRIVDNEGSGIEVGSRSGGGTGNRTVIAKNILRGNHNGVFLQHTDTTISVVGNRIQNTTRESIWVAVVDGDVAIADNAVRDGSGHGIVLDSTDDVVVRNNTVRAVGGAGIRLEHESTGNLLASNRIVDNHRGLHITGRSGRTTVRGLVVSDSQNRAILFDGVGNNTLVDTKVRRGDGIDVKSAGNALWDISVTDTQGFGIRFDGANDSAVRNATVASVRGPAFEAVGTPSNVSVRNFSVTSGRVSLLASDSLVEAVVDSVETVPTPPDGKYNVGVAVRVYNSVAVTEDDDPTRLTVFHPHLPSYEVTLWRHDDGTWARMENASAHPGRDALSIPLPPKAEFVVVPLVSTPLPTPTPGRTGTRTKTQSPTLSPSETGEPPTSVSETPGFGVLIGLCSLIVFFVIVVAVD